MSTLSAQQVYCLALQAGWQGDDAIRMTVIAFLESGYRTDARNPEAVCTNTACGHATGLWQVVDFPTRKQQYGNLTNPQTNAKAAHDIWQSQGYAAWSTWTRVVASTVNEAISLATNVPGGLDIQAVKNNGSAICGATNQGSSPPSVPNPVDAISGALHSATASVTGMLSSTAGAILGAAVMLAGAVVAAYVFMPSQVRSVAAGASKAAHLVGLAAI